MDLELESEDFELLKRILEGYISDLRMEIAGTDKLSWRQSMHADEDRAKALLQRLSEPEPAPAEAAELRIIVRGFIARVSE